LPWIDLSVWLQAENPAYPDLRITDGQSLEVWGVIKRNIRKL
jgi:SOS-response transcriptional repressor LexA